jgi:hypothetical protein
MALQLAESDLYWRNSAGRSRWCERMARSVVQNGTRRAKLWATRSRSNGSRVQSSRRAWRTRGSIVISSMVNLLSSITVFMNSGLRTESRPTSARNWISRKETGDTPQGRYPSNHGNAASRFDPRTSQIRKWVSRRRVTVPAAAKQDHAQGLATPRTIDPPHRLSALSGVFYTEESLCQPWCRLIPRAAAQSVALFVRPRSLHPEELRRGVGTIASWPQMPSRSSYVQCTTPGSNKSKRASIALRRRPWPTNLF